MISVSTYLIVSLNLSSDLKNEIFSNHDITIIYFFIYFFIFNLNVKKEKKKKNHDFTKRKEKKRVY